MEQKRRYIRLVGPDGRLLKIAIKNEALRALADRIRIRDISIGGISMTVPGAGNAVFSGMSLDLAILLPTQEICWLTGTIVHVTEDVCHIRFEEDFYEQKKLSRYMLHREREIIGYANWKDKPAEGSLGEDILDGIWREESEGQTGREKTGREKILVLSTAGGAFSFLEEGYDLMTVADAGLAGEFRHDLILVDSDNLTLGSSGGIEDWSHPVIEETPVVVSVAGQREINFIAIRTRRPSGRISYSMAATRFRTEMPGILAALLMKYGRNKP